MDPFSLTLGVISLASLAAKTAVQLKKLRDDATEASTINGMLADIKALRGVLQSIEDGVEELDARAPLTGHIGTHWSALKATVSDGCDSMNRLNEILMDVNKEVKLLDSVRRGRRLKEANDDIAIYRQQIQAYKDTLQLSLQSITFFQEVSIKEDTSKLLDSSDKIQQDLSRLGANLEVKLSALQLILETHNEAGSTSNTSIRRLRTTVQTAATVMSSSSTALSDEREEALSEIGDMFTQFTWFSEGSSPEIDLSLDFASPNQSALQLSHMPNIATQLSNEPPENATKVPPDTAVAETSHSTSQGQQQGLSTNGNGIVSNGSAPRPAPIERSRTESKGSDSDESPNLPSKDTTSGTKSKTKHDAKSKRRSFSLSKLFSPRSPRPNEVKKDLRNPLCMDHLNISPTGQIPIKMTFVGDGAAGKTCFLIASSTGIFAQVYVPTVFENYVADFAVDGLDFNCALWDTAGQDDYSRLRPLSYPDTKVFFICFAIDNPSSFENARDEWIYEIRKFRKGEEPIFLLGFKKDLRYDPGTLQELAKTQEKPITYKQGEELARKIGAAGYFESSAIMHENTKQTFESVLKMILEASPGLKRRYKDGRWKRKAAKLLQADEATV